MSWPLGAGCSGSLSPSVGVRSSGDNEGALGGRGVGLLKTERGKSMDIPSPVLEAIGKGECTLFLGAGASNPAGVPSGEELSDLITDEFLDDNAQDWGLNLASAVSLAAAQPGMNRGDIERFVHERLDTSNPSPAHLKIPWFRWRAIITTNYDCLIEKSYVEEVRAIQRLVPVLREEGLPGIGATGPEIVPLLKPHGSTSHPESMALSLEDIYQAKQKRRLLFTYIELLHLLGPVIYIGYSFRDIHILDMIYDLTSRLGPYRKPILFVTLQRNPNRAKRERNWIQGQLKGIYLADGFEQFMDGLVKQITPAIAPSMIIRQMAPCRTMTFAASGLASDTVFYKIGQGEEGEWEYWLTYSINHSEGFAGVIFERREDGTVDVSQYVQVTFELNIPKEPRKADEAGKADYIEAKLESAFKRYELKLELETLSGEGWKEVTLPFGKQNVSKNVVAGEDPPGVAARLQGGRRVPGSFTDQEETRLRRVVLADNGQRAILGHEYRIGIRKIKFE